MAAHEGLALVTELLSELLAFGWLVATSAVDVVHYPPPTPAARASVAILVIWSELVSQRNSLGTESAAFSIVLVQSSAVSFPSMPK